MVSVGTPSGVDLAVTDAGQENGRPVIVLHGVAGTGESVLRDSELRDDGFRVVTYDARGHGSSSAPIDRAEYGYDAMLEDLLAVMDTLRLPRAVLAGVSMGGLTALRLAIRHPTRAAGLVLITPAYDPTSADQEAVLRADRIADALDDGDLDRFLAMDPIPSQDPRIAAAFGRFLRHRLSGHRTLSTVADSLRVVMRSRPFESWGDLASVSVPTLVVASNDQLDPNHPQAVAEAYASTLPVSEVVHDEPGGLPLAWRGRELARLVLAFCRRTYSQDYPCLVDPELGEETEFLDPSQRPSGRSS